MSKKEQERYDELYKLEGYFGSEASPGLKRTNQLINLVGGKIKTILDVGCGSGHSVREFLKKGYGCKGVETSEYLIKNQLRDLVKKGLVKKNSADNLEFEDKSFDITFCTDVMEHIPINEIPRAIKEMSRVSRRYLFFTIEYGPSDFKEGGKDLHVTQRNRRWWIKTIERFGEVKLIKPSSLWNYVITLKTLRFKFIKKQDYFLFEKIK
ncbi:MAG: class I SAM-dependent methyltransferase [Candidatus Pacearchaeota archaeon]|jgi:ubiquinone/menaquinone biosynthesis C-methylase UbiE